MFVTAAGGVQPCGHRFQSQSELEDVLQWRPSKTYKQHVHATYDGCNSINDTSLSLNVQMEVRVVNVLLFNGV